MQETHPILAREGWGHIAVTLAAAIGAGYGIGWSWSIPLFAAFVFCVQFFRDPHRQRPEGENLVLSPADGRVIAVGRFSNPYGKGEALKISVFMNVFNVHSNRIPCDGEVAALTHHAGKFVNAALDKASESNERQIVRMRCGSHDVTVVQIAGLIARRIKCYLNEGQKVEAAKRFGFIRFGSRVDLYLPIDSTPKASIGDKVKAGLDVVALLPAGEVD